MLAKWHYPNLQSSELVRQVLFAEPKGFRPHARVPVLLDRELGSLGSEQEAFELGEVGSFEGDLGLPNENIGDAAC